MNLSSFPCFLFLDIDGVLVTENGFRRRSDGSLPDRDQHGHIFDEDCVRNLGELLQETGAGIVVTSSWRTRDLHDMHVTELARQEWCAEPALMRSLWAYRGLPGTIVDCTPYFTLTFPNNEYVHLPRGVEIDAWQRRYGVSRVPYAIIDDEGDFLLSRKNRLVQTDIKDGLTREHTQTATALLRKPVLWSWEEERLAQGLPLEPFP